MSLQPTSAAGMRTRCAGGLCDWRKMCRNRNASARFSGGAGSLQLGSLQVTDVAAAMQISASNSSEVGFNMACALLQLGSFTEAEKQLQLALRAGVHDWKRMRDACPM
jgi:hypothetical protein